MPAWAQAALFVYAVSMVHVAILLVQLIKDADARRVVDPDDLMNTHPLFSGAVLTIFVLLAPVIILAAYIDRP